MATFIGNAGDDTFAGTPDDDLAAGNDGNDTLRGGDGSDSLEGGTGDDVLNGDAGTDQLIGGEGDDLLDGGIGDDILWGGTGNDIFYIDGADAAIEKANEGIDLVRASTAVYMLGDNLEILAFVGTGDFAGVGNALGNAIDGGAGNDDLQGLAGNDTLSGGDGMDTLDGGTGNDVVNGNAGDDQLIGGADNDVLDGGAGDDWLRGGTGDDIYYADGPETITELADEGIDLVRARGPAYWLDANVENLAFVGTGNFDGRGNALDNVIDGGDGDDFLEGMDGNDTLRGGDVGMDELHGGLGNDTYLVDHDTRVVELADEGTDTVRTTMASYTLEDNVENLVFVGTGDFFGQGNALANAIDGGDGDDLLQGLDGNDTLRGGLGGDQLEGGDGDDVLVLGEGELGVGEVFDGGDGTDWLRYTGTSEIDLSTSTLTGVDALQSTGAAVIGVTRIQYQNFGFINAAVRITDGGTIQLNHMTLANGTIYLSDFGNTFDMTPGTLLVPVTVHGGASSDTVIGIGNADTVYGAGGDDLLFSGAGDDLLQGGAGQDAVFGEAGNDVLVLGEGELSGGETFNGGADTDTLRYTGTSDIDLSGTTITGIERLEATNGAVIGLTRAQLSGFASIDAAVLITDGGYVTLAGKTLANGTIYLADLANYIDLGTANALVPLTVHGGALYDTILGHNVLVDTLYGGDGDDLIDGGGGDDLMYGGAGNDQYYVTGTGDQVFENAGEGVDLVATSLSSYTLGANLENLTLFGVTNSSGTGNSADNVIRGSLGRNTLTGGAGRDEFYGDFGNDTLVVAQDDAATGEVYDGGDGTDLLRYDGTSVADFSGSTILSIETLTSTNGGVIGLTVAQLESLLTVNAPVWLTDGGAVNLSALTLGSNFFYLSDTGTTIDFGTLVNAVSRAMSVVGGGGSDTITGTGNADTLYGGGGNDSINGGAGGDIMVGGAGNDYYTVDNAGDQVYESAGEGYDTVYTSTSNYTLADNVEGLVTLGTGYFTGIGNGLGNDIVGGEFGNNIDGRGGNDIIYGGAGADTLRGADGTDAVYGRAGNDVFQIAEGDVAMGDRFDGGADNDQITYLGVIDFDLSIATIAGVESLHVDWGTTVSLTIAQLQGFSTVDAVVRLTDGGVVDLAGTALAKGILYLSEYGNTIDLSSAASIPSGMSVHGGGAQDVITGTATDDDQLFGGGGNDVLDGLAGDDVMTGGTGDDTYHVDSAGDEVVENADEGHDTVQATLASYTLAADVEDLVYAGGSAFTGTGNSLDNVITGGDGNDTLIGGGGADDLRGGWGNDTFVVGEGDLVDGARFDGGEGNDTLRYTGSSTIDLSGATLTGIEKLEADNDATLGLTVAQLASLGYVGPGVAVRLTDAGALTLSSMLLVHDLYLADAATVPGGTIGSFIDVSNTLVAFPLTIHGSSFDDTIIGTDGQNDTLYGGGGRDSLSGGSGDDTLVLAEGDYVAGEIYDGGSMTDTLRYAGSSNLDLSGATITGIERLVSDNAVTVSLTVAQLESLTYVGPTVTVRLVDGGPADLGGLTFEGSALYLSDDGNAVDLRDLVNASTAWFTVHGGAGQDQITGGANNDTLNGGGESDVLDGSGGDDAMTGGTGDDTYTVDSVGDQVNETADEGTDRVVTALASYMLGANVENLTYGGSGNFVGTGNALDNAITGGAGNDTLTGGWGNDWLDGGWGVDFLTGGTGDDTYVVDNSGDQVNEDLDAGIDTVRATAASFTLSTNIENLLYVGSGNFSGTGNGLANRIDGGAGNDLLKGMAGDDVLTGGGGDDELQGGVGNDWYYVDQAGDVVVEAAGGGSDRVLVSASYALGAGVEVELITTTRTVGTGAIDLAGNELDNRIHGNAGANLLSGGAGDDALSGNAGDDVLIGGDGRDRIEGGDGFDTASYATAGARVTVRLDRVGAQNTGGGGADKLASIEGVIGSAFADTLVGDAQDNVLSGGDGSDSLNGAGGNDTLIGGAGNDYYLVDGAGVTVVETADAGIDTVRAGIDYTIADNVENLILAGAARAGTGNALDNALTGAGASNTLRGLAGNDALFGGGGRDTLEGGDGGDLLDGGAGKDTLTGGSGSDVFAFHEGDLAETRALADVITDFSQADGETIRLNTVDADLTVAGDQGFAWIGNGAFTGVAGQLHYALQSGTTYVEGDLNGDGAADFVIALTGALTLTAADFVL